MCGGVTVRQGPAWSHQDVWPRASEVGVSPTGLRVRDLVSQGPCEGLLTCDLLCSCAIRERGACRSLRRQSRSCCRPAHQPIARTCLLLQEGVERLSRPTEEQAVGLACGAGEHASRSPTGTPAWP